jgi:hypothetical protein
MIMIKRFCYVLVVTIAIFVGTKCITHEMVDTDRGQLGGTSCDQKLGSRVCSRAAFCGSYKYCVNNAATGNNIKDCVYQETSDANKQCYSAENDTCRQGLQRVIQYSNNCE